MTITEFSPKQRFVMKWWNMRDYGKRDAIICDGAVRSGKTLSMSLGFLFWAGKCFDGCAFAMCGKTITSLRRNVVTPLLPMLSEYGFAVSERVSGNYFDITLLGRTNRVYLFGGRDESSAALIQGMTLAGVFFDEVALMPRSFVEQALARCSVSGSKMWFNCNPDNPSHWFYNEWIKKLRAKNALYLHFSMDDNPSLSDSVRRRYERMYSGTFYDRFILGKWTASRGVVYPMFSGEKHVFSEDIDCERYIISCDYGTVKDCSANADGKLMLPFGSELIKTSAVDDDTVIGIDRDFALEFITSTDLVMETDKLIDRQLDQMTVSITCGFRRITPDAVKVLTVTANE